ncbi:MAG: rhomboid family intramembrane serine protease [Bacteroidota bacterium]
MTEDSRKSFRNAAFHTGILLGSITAFFVFENLLDGEWYWMGVRPRSIIGLPGIITSPLKHHDLGHLLNNLLLMAILSIGLFLHVSMKRPYFKLFTISIIANIWLWIAGREAWHYGASGIVYGLFFYLLTIAIKRKQKELYLFILSCLMLSLGFFVGLFPVDVTVSFEGHLFGGLAGILVALTEKKNNQGKPPVSNVTFSRNASFEYQYKSKDGHS